MSVPAKLKTTGQLRAFLADMMVGVKNGHVDPDKASRITKLAAQVNESFYSEIKVAKTLSESGKAFSEFGDLPISAAEAKA